MEEGSIQSLRHRLNFTFYDLPATTVRIDFPAASGAETMMLASIPAIQIGASYMESGLVINNLLIQPRRIQFEIASAPALLPITLQIACPGPFVFGWLLVPGIAQTGIATAAQQVRIVGPGYWALPLGTGSVVPESPPTSTTTQPPKGGANGKSGSAVTKSSGSEAATNSTTAKPDEKGVAARSGPASAKVVEDSTVK